MADLTPQKSENVQAISTPVLKKTSIGWTIDLCDSAGNHLMSSAVYPSKFLAEEALDRIKKAS
jgi:hypothetical protein